MNEAYQSHSVEMRRDGHNLFDSIARILILILFFLLPLFFLPTLFAPFQLGKSTLIAVFLFLALISFVIGRLREGNFPVIHNALLYSVWLLPIVYVVSALYNGSAGKPYVGSGLEVDTVLFMLLGALLLTLSAFVFKTKRHLLLFLTALLATFGLLFLFEAVRLMSGGSILSLNVLSTLTANPLGKWNDLGIFMGLTTVLALVTLEGLSLRGISKIIVIAVLLLSLLGAMVINFTSVWIALAVVGLAFFIFGLIRGRLPFKRVLPTLSGDGEVEAVQKKSVFSVYALIVLIISLFFIFAADTAGNALSTTLGISQVEARPSFETTVMIAKEVYKDNLLFGVGPNNFVSAWTQFKPTAINETIFWSSDFTAGIGVIPTSAITTGVAGLLAWILFLLAFLYVGIRSLVLSPYHDPLSYFFSLATFVGALYLFAMAVIYIENVVLIAFAFMFGGLFIASLRHQDGLMRERIFVFSDNARLGFVAVLLLTVVLLGSVAALYSVSKLYASSYAFQRSVVLANTSGEIEPIERSLALALRLRDNDRYLRLQTELHLSRLSAILTDEGLSTEERRARFQSVFADTVRVAKKATEINPNFYQNWLALGRVYQAVIPLQIEGAYENARSAYYKALELAPNNPLIYLTRARLELARENTGGAKELIGRALELKSNYTAAIFLLSQIEISEGDIPAAIRSVEAAAFIDPNNPVIHFQLGILRYSTENYEGAIEVLERAVELNNDYANARYFLGLSYAEQGERIKAVEQFERIAFLNPENEEVKLILENLRAGRPPFTDSNLSGEVEEREELPIEGE